MIAPKQKAKELVDKFYNVNDASEQGVGTNPYISRGYAKQCALIAVDEILKEIQPKDPNDYCSPLVKSRADYWVSVKQEIQAL